MKRVPKAVMLCEKLTPPPHTTTCLVCARNLTTGMIHSTHFVDVYRYTWRCGSVGGGEMYGTVLDSVLCCYAGKVLSLQQSHAAQSPIPAVFGHVEKMHLVIGLETYIDWFTWGCVCLFQSSAGSLSYAPVGRGTGLPLRHLLVTWVTGLVSD